MAAGDTREEALTRLGDAMRGWVKARIEEGLEIPEPMTDYGGKVVVQIPRSLHRDVMHRAEHEGVRMNQWFSTTLARAVGGHSKVAGGEPRHVPRAGRARGRSPVFSSRAARWAPDRPGGRP